MKLFTVSIDTEADCDADWIGADPESYMNLKSLREKLLPVANKNGAVMTLLLNGDIIDRDEPSSICELLQSEAGWELGTHMHGEFTEPNAEFTGPAGIRLKDFQCGYPRALEYKKMQTLTDSFVDRFGKRPTAFRAGRFGAGQATFDACLQLGYKVDTSVVPGARLQEGEAVADFRSFSCLPKVVASDGSRRLIEIPVTVRPGVVPPPLRDVVITPCTGGRVCVDIFSQMKSAINRVVLPLYQATWLRPSYGSSRQMIKVLTWLSQQQSQAPLVANMMFHSNELLPGASPYCTTPQQVDNFLTRLSEVFVSAKQQGFKFVTLTEAAEILERRLP